MHVASCADTWRGRKKDLKSFESAETNEVLLIVGRVNLSFDVNLNDEVTCKKSSAYSVCVGRSELFFG